MPSVSIIGTRGYPSHYGGFETAVRKLAPFLADAGWEVSVYGRDDEPPTSFPTDDRIKVIPLRAPRRKSLETLLRGLQSTLHAVRSKPDVVLVMNVANGYFLPILRYANIPTLVNVDGIEWERSKWGPIARKVFKIGALLTARFADAIVVDSLAIGRRWELELRREGVFIPYGGDPHLSLDAPAGLERRKYVLMVARLVPENSVEEFFQAAAQLALRWPVVVVGTSGFAGAIDERARKLASAGIIIWLGHISDDLRLQALWENAGVYFHGHSVGGTNPALVQAMTSGAPTLARDTSYNREVLGDAGLYCEAKAQSIVDKVNTIMDDPKMQNHLSQAAIKRAAHHYSWQAVCAKYQSALQQLNENREQC